jgi:glycosylphosphatidylinositol transamidase (GPIT) subunit GPI8
MAGAGRPTSYRDEYVEQAEKLSLLGATDIQIADFFGVSESTLNLWKHTHQKFSESLKVGKTEADRNVVRSLYRKAVGYEFDSVKIFCNKDGEITQVPYREVVPPSDTACIFWLKNRQRKDWQDKQVLAGDEDAPLVVRHIGRE